MEKERLERGMPTSYKKEKGGKGLRGRHEKSSVETKSHRGRGALKTNGTRLTQSQKKRLEGKMPGRDQVCCERTPTKKKVPRG